MKTFLSQSRHAAFLATALTLSTATPTFAEQPAPGGIEWQLLAVEDEDGDWWNAFKIATVPGVRYDIQKTGDLQSPWQSVASYYGGGMEVIHPLFPGQEPTDPPNGNPTVLPSPGSSSLKFAFFVMERTSEGSVVLSLRSLDSQLPVRHLLDGVTLDPVWDEFENGYVNIHGDHLMSVIPRLHSPVQPPAPSVLGPEDQEFIAAFTTALPQITSNISNSVAAAAVATPPPPPDPNSKGFFRIRADWAVDSDSDSRFDWQEVLLDGNNPFNADSDGDGNSDAAMPEIPIAGTPAAPQRPPVAQFEHRYVVGSKTMTFTGQHLGIWGYAIRSDEHEWTNGDAKFDAMMMSWSFLETTSAAAGFPIESEWQSGVRSLEAVNLLDHGTQGNVEETNWTNFKMEYRLKLPSPAPEGGYAIPLTFAKLHHEWDDLANVWMPASPLAGESSTMQIILTVEEGATGSAPTTVPLLEDVGVNRRVTLVPSDIAILEGDRSPPADGLCLQLGEGFSLDFNGTSRPSHECLVPDEWISWQIRRLKYDGSFEDWQTLREPISQQPVKGCEVDTSISELYGCFQLRAFISNGTAAPVPLPAVRMRDATHAIDRMGTKNPKLIAGQPEYLGVANCQVSEAVRNGAVKWLGSTDYALSANMKIKPGYPYNPSLVNKNKCNVFVTHVANANGAQTPYFFRYAGIVPTAPIARDDWFSAVESNVDLDEPGWIYLGLSERPTPGMAVATYGTAATGSGHCGILDYDGAWINAGKISVNKSIHPTHPTPDYQDYRMRMRTDP